MQHKIKHAVIRLLNYLFIQPPACTPGPKRNELSLVCRSTWSTWAGVRHLVNGGERVRHINIDAGQQWLRNISPAWCLVTSNQHQQHKQLTWSLSVNKLLLREVNKPDGRVKISSVSSSSSSSPGRANISSSAEINTTHSCTYCHQILLYTTFYNQGTPI